VFAPIPETFVIGLGHKARQGKDTAAQILCGALPGRVQRFSFADDLYAVCRVLHGMTAKDAPLLQRVGCAERERDPHVWIRSVYGKILDARPGYAVITDVRFENEMDFVRQLGGECWRVDRVLSSGARFVDPSRPANHPSEIALDGARWDRVIENPDGDPETFKQRVVAAFFSQAQRGAVAAC
jgi:hypothetical protein